MKNTKHLQLIKRVDILENRRTVIYLNLLTIPLLIIFVFIFKLIVDLTRMLFVENSNISFMNFFAFAMFLIISLIIHELIHGLFFKIFNPQGKLKFGFKSGMLYASSVDSYYSKIQAILILMAPFTILTVLYSLLFFLQIMTPLFYISIAALHGSGCIGDFWFTYLLLKSPKNIVMCDTKVGIDIYLVKEASN
ncbi:MULTISPECIES: DUF3267 domain-containing protein [unclassified Enterococcus]|uniref:DUF3267 domain-containing protein n=1 Tax=unclassified Enterococcus TaxID=2608891 RepID=UPI00155484AA|nr:MULTISPECIES: DUF3267 domain-containing protein [unclassified Enterococcus]MBS7577563.1 DUF3267 domain-containing protein [Enterococcus sp. MMGLQ5-2]MBS7584938.1 DUF3267 domain-containing protein [Enterococcus sp. MMGLQ5-1]NPD12793.1 DUF3267 domain-containing protein [Enterococcus sp. MMGLQ5-1]NPD37396.1 DUF3267 domain-containing protein [Enterococcus sp. MMGLQ5-2]